MNNVLLYVYKIITVVFALTVHELCHGYVSYILGDRTAKNQGRLTLNPLSHLDLFGSIMMLFFGFGWAKPIPVNPSYYKNKKLGMILTAAAGPFSNVVMAFVAMGIVKLVNPIYSVEAVRYLCSFLLVFAQCNFFLGVFNLIPVPPLDGGKILYASLPYKYYNFYLKYENFGLIAISLLVIASSFGVSFTGWINILFYHIFNTVLGV